MRISSFRPVQAALRPAKWELREKTLIAGVF
jgi:hypothetical protein